MTTREQAYAALWALLIAQPQIAANFNTLGRYLRPLEDVSAVQMPALYMFQVGETWERIGKGMPAKRTLNCHVVFYIATNAAGGVLPATLMNNAMDALDDVLYPPGNPGNVQNLGGLVEWVYLADGDVKFYEGLLQDKSPVVIPVRILLP